MMAALLHDPLTRTPVQLAAGATGSCRLWAGVPSTGTSTGALGDPWTALYRQTV